MTRRRITQREVEEGTSGRVAAALASGPTRVGTLEGVNVDFRHPELSAGDWEARPWWHVWGPSPDSAGIIFPGEGQLDLEQLRKEKDSCEHLQPFYASTGDRVTIEHVIPQISDSRFDHPHDRERRLAYLVITRSDGETVRPTHPLTFYGVTQLRSAPRRDAFDRLVARICLQFGVENLGSLDPHTRPGPELPLEIQALDCAKEAMDSYFKLSAVLPPAGRESAWLRRTINQAMLAGYFQAKAEARKAERTASGVMQNREKATEKVTRLDWREKAERIWSQNPEWKRTRVARLIAEGTDDDPRSISRAIKNLVPVPCPPPKGG